MDLICENCKTPYRGSRSKLRLCADCKTEHYRKNALARYYALRVEETVSCVRCGTETPSKSGPLKYCPACRREVDRERGRSEHTKEMDRKRYAKDPNSKTKSRERVQKWREKYPDRFREIINNWMKKNPDKTKVNLHRRRERQKSDNPLTSQQWRDIQASYSHKCAYCGNGGKMTIEHVIPLAKGGTHTAENVVPACLDCNRKKNRLPLLQFMYKMLQA